MRIDSQKQHREILATAESRNLEGTLAALFNHLTYTSNDLQSCMRAGISPRSRANQA
jgi:DNA-binding GntR family transcriptional regulator